MTAVSLRRSVRDRPATNTTPFVAASAAVIQTLAAVALANRYFAKKVERDNPPSGRFLKINGVRLHYVERGAGDPVVLLHGNGSMIQDFESSGLIDLLAEDNRVIVFDRPGFGQSFDAGSKPYGAEEVRKERALYGGGLR